jgi:acetoin utilization deacetylase AcuC-like enzyme
MRAVYSPSHLLHDPGFEVTGGRRIPAWEVTGRGEIIRAALDADPAFELEGPTEHGVEPIDAVHDPAMVRYLETAWSEWRRAGTGAEAIVPDTIIHPSLREGMGKAPEPTSPCGRIGYWCYDTASPIVPGTYRAARDAVDVALTTAGMVLDGEPMAYGLCRPPGHHAARAMFGGYCYFNNAAITTHWLTGRTGGPVAILDVDYHHGNGSQQIFWERADVAYASLHADPNRTYPYYAGHADETGGGAGAGANFNQPLPAGTTDEQYLAAIDRALDWLSGKPGELLVVSLGIDTYGQDPIGDLALTTPVYHEVGRRVAASGRRLVILQEGGYYVPALGENVRQWLRGALGLPLDLTPRREDGPTAS